MIYQERENILEKVFQSSRYKSHSILSNPTPINHPKLSFANWHSYTKDSPQKVMKSVMKELSYELRNFWAIQIYLTLSPMAEFIESLGG